MSLNHFFTINLPYGLARQKDGGWMAFNREYLPMGFNQKARSTFPVEEWEGLPIYTKYEKITELFLLKLAFDENSVRRDEDGKINKIWLYNDLTNPTNHKNFNNKYWIEYCKKLNLLAKLNAIHT